MMVFNPVYIKKSNDGEAQLFGNGFPNQKPTYLFSDIIKVILAKTEQPVGSDIQNADDNTGNISGIDTSDNPLMISDAEVELFDRLIKLNSVNATLENLQAEEKAGKQIVLDSLQMYLKGLTNKEEITNKEEKSFEIDKSDLLVVLNLLAGNIFENNDIPEMENDFALELKGFIEEVEALVDKIDITENKKIVIERSDFAIALKPLENGKINLELISKSTPDTKNEILNKVTPVDAQKVHIPESETSFNQLSHIPTAQTTEKIFTENTEVQKESLAEVNEKTVTNKQIHVEHKNVAKEDKPKIDAAAKESVNKEVNTTVKENEVKDFNQSNYRNEKTTHTKSSINELKVSAENKIIFKIDNSHPDAKPVVNNDNSKSAINIKPIETKEYFNGKISIDVVSVKEDSNKTSTLVKTEAINVSKVTDAQPKIFNLPKVENVEQQNSTVTPDASKIINEFLNTTAKTIEIKAKTTVDKTHDNVSKNLQQTPDKQTLTPQTEANTMLKDETIETEHVVKTPVKEKTTKPVNLQSANVSSSENKTTEIKNESTDSINQKQTTEYVVVDKKNSTEDVNKNNADSEKIVVGKEKSSKVVTSNKEADQQKPDSQNQHTFDKTPINFSKAVQLGKDIKEAVKVVDQSRLMNEIENVIKNGDRKLVQLNLYPEELGSVKISLDVNDKVINAKIDVTSDSVRQIILTQAENLKTSLTQSGIQLASLNVSVNNPDEKNSQQGKTKRKDGSVNKKIVIKDIPQGAKVKNLGYNTYDYIV